MNFFSPGTYSYPAPANTLEIFPLKGENLTWDAEQKPGSLDENSSNLNTLETSDKFSNLSVSSPIRWE